MNRDYNLDMIRGVAALLVCASHLRAFMFVAYDELDSPGLAEVVFYAVTGLGHQSVLIFFALSGYLVGGKALEAVLARRFRFSSYLIARLSRLWTVLLPGLVLTLAWDAAGIELTGGAGYDGRWHAVVGSGPAQISGADLSPLTFLGNLTFLHSIVVPFYGSNGPLWSLAYEFWYYAVIPFAFIAAIRGWRSDLRAAALLWVAVAVWLLPAKISLLGLIWLAGALVHGLQSRIVVLPRWLRVGAGVVVLVGFIGLLGVNRIHQGLWSDLAFGLACAACLPVAAAVQVPSHHYRMGALWSSEISYTLYVVHFPPMAFFAFVHGGGERLDLSTGWLAVYLSCFIVAVGYAALLWWFFERRTPALRTWASARLIAQRA